jgi:hypothetical protein
MTENPAKQVEIDPALYAELQEVAADPAQVVNIAVRQWLQRRALIEAEKSVPLAVNPPVPPRGEWND